MQGEDVQVARILALKKPCYKLEDKTLCLISLPLFSLLKSAGNHKMWQEVEKKLPLF